MTRRAQPDKERRAELRAWMRRAGLSTQPTKAQCEHVAAVIGPSLRDLDAEGRRRE